MKCSCRKFGRAGSFCLSLRCCTVTRDAPRLQCLTPAKADGRRADCFAGLTSGHAAAARTYREMLCRSRLLKVWPPADKDEYWLPQFRDLPRVPMPPNWSTRYLLGLIRPGPAFSGYLRIAGQMRPNTIWLVWGSVFHAWQVQNFRR